jgi:hypothetical protein
MRKLITSKKALFFFSISETNWKQKTLGMGIGRMAICLTRGFPDTYYFCIGINLIFWFITTGIRMGEVE